MGWSDKYKAPAGASGGGDGLFLKIESGESVEFLVPPGAVPHQKFRFWNQGTGKFEDRDGPGEGVTVRVLMPVYVPSKSDTKVLEMAYSTFKDLAKCLDHARVGGIEQLYEISREGSKKDTRWKITRIDRADDAMLQRAASASIPDLSQWAEPMEEVGESSSSGSSASTSSRSSGKGRAEPAPVPDDHDIPF